MVAALAHTCIRREAGDSVLLTSTRVATPALAAGTLRPRSSLEFELSMNAPTAPHEGHKEHDAHEARFLEFFVVVFFVLIVSSAAGRSDSSNSSELWD
jgi:hypothetical protein